ncbi:hypothetical protein HPY86_07030 [candidate division WOR-3 bacterium]|nr:hypothetical protein [candidate division WOR-3 bacterium]
MKRAQTLITILFILPLLIYAEEGFFTRNVMRKDTIQQVSGYIECWRANNQSPSPERYATLAYNPMSPTYPEYLHWWNGGEPPLDYGWDYTFIGWRLENNDTLFSDYTDWTSYPDNTVCDTFDLYLQYPTTRPAIPRRQ